MLVYKSGFDIYHSMFRIVSLLNRCPNNEIEYDRARIFDYYFAFPHRVFHKVKHIKGSGFTKSQFKTGYNKYLSTQDDKQIFFEMSKVFEGAARCLAAYGEINVEMLKIGILSLDKTDLTESSVSLMDSIDPIRTRILDLFTGPFYSVQMSGNNGLKARTGLMEHRYDI